MVRHALVVVLWLSPAVAVAQKADAKASANALFDEGKRLLAAGSVDRACLKFEASLQLFDQLGVRLNLADCHERQGRTATAWAEFREAASQADKRGDRRAAFARRRTEALAPRLVKLRISIAAANDVPELTVRRDGVAIPRDAFDTALPVDPGRYAIEASAPDHVAWSTTVTATTPGELATVEVPRLNAAPVKLEPPRPRPLPSPPEPRVAGRARPPDKPALDDSTHQRRRWLALGVGAGGIAAAGAGVALGLAAKSKWDAVGTHCGANHMCDAIGLAANRDARRLGTIGTIAGGVGIAALAAGTLLYLTAPAARPIVEHVRLDPDRDAPIRIAFAGQF